MNNEHSENKKNSEIEKESATVEKKKRGRKKSLIKNEDGFSVNFTEDELNIIDVKLLGTTTDRELSRQWGIPRAKIFRLRKKLNIKAFDYKNNCNKVKTEKLISFLKENEGKLIGIQDIFDIGVFLLNNEYLSKQRIKEFGEKHGIKVTFKSDKEYEHSHRQYMKGCRCDICKLSISIYMKYKRVVSVRFCNYLANEYLSVYKQDTTRFHRQFFSFVESEINKVLDIEKPDPESSETIENPELVKHELEDSNKIQNLDQKEFSIKETLRKEFSKNSNLRQELLKSKLKIH